MRKIIIIGVAIAAFGLTSSCKKCTTCTFNDPEKGEISSEVCGTGNVYQTGIDVHTQNGWTCK